MVTFNGQNLFASGPMRFQIGALRLRHVTHAAPSGQGVQLASQGREAREIIQTGTLIADTPTLLQQQVDAIDVNLNGMAYTLVDDLDRSWNNTAMLRFEPQLPMRVGVKWKLDYLIEYLQVTP